jgi:death on curing protein
MIEPCWLEPQDIRAIHNEILAESGGDPCILSDGALESTLNKPKNLYCYESNVDLYNLAASYGYGLVKNHCFIDGNKRVALIAVYMFLSINGIELEASEADAANFFLDLAASIKTQEKEMQRLADWLKLNSDQNRNEVIKTSNYITPSDYDTMPEDLKDKPENAWVLDDHRRNADEYDLVSEPAKNCPHVKNGLCLESGIPEEFAQEFANNLYPGDCSHFPDCTLDEYWLT